MASIYDNGGMIGSTLNFGSTDRYILSTSTELDTPVYVGGMVIDSSGGTSPYSAAFLLSGGISSTPSTGDLVVVCFGTSYASVDAVLNVTHYGGSYAGSSYTKLVDAYANGTYDSQLYVGYSFMGSSVATGVTFPNESFTFSSDLLVTIHVWRNINPTQPIDALATPNIRTTSGVPLFYGITTITDKSVILSVSYSSHNGDDSSYSPASLSDNFIQTRGKNAYDNTIGMSSYPKITAGYTVPQAYTWSEVDSASFTNISASVALRPSSTTTTIYGNYKNSGIWSLGSVLDLLKV